MHAVCETHAFRRAAFKAGMSEDDIFALVSYLAENPNAGDIIRGTGGCRKLRWAGRSKGKSGGYRTITFYSGAMMPVYLVTVFGKGERANLSDAECNGLRALTKALAAEHRDAVAAMVRRKDGKEK
jgi:hypothetical protein